MYLGRIVAVGRTGQNANCAMYRVSSRSFPNRETVKLPGSIAVMPRRGFEDDLKKNPYITYNCLRIAGEFAVVSNGSHTDPIAEKIAMGVPVRDAMALGLLAMDYEKDQLDTPRIIAAVHLHLPVGFLGIVQKHSLLVREVELEPGMAYHLSTYEHNFPCERFVDRDFRADCAEEAARFIVSGGSFAEYENPVTAAAAMACGNRFETAAIAQI